MVVEKLTYLKNGDIPKELLDELEQLPKSSVLFKFAMLVLESLGLSYRSTPAYGYDAIPPQEVPT